MKNFLSYFKLDQVGILLLTGISIFLLAEKSPWGHVIGLCAQPFWFYSSVTNKQWGIVLNTAWFVFAYSLGIRNGFFPQWNMSWQIGSLIVMTAGFAAWLYKIGLLPDFLLLRYFRVKLKLSDEGCECSYDVIINGASERTIQNAIFRAGFPVVNASIERIPRPDKEYIFAPTVRINSYKKELANMKAALVRYDEILELNTFDPVLWRHQLEENSRQKDLLRFRTQILGRIKKHYDA